MYIKDLRFISPQPTFENNFFAEAPTIHVGVQYKALEPSYAGVVPNSILRRMGKSNRLATGAAMPLLSKYKTDGIIIGTTDGGMDDCHRFLDQIIKYEEGTLTPTGFVQGSPNSAAGGLALMNRNDGYNITHSNRGLSFENCVVDAQMLMAENEAESLLIGCVEEISKAQLRIETLAGYVKSESEISSDNLLQSATTGAVVGEGAAMFVVQKNRTDALARVADVAVVSSTDPHDITTTLNQLLSKNEIGIRSIDSVILGKNGDASTDHHYDAMLDNLPEDSSAFTFKNLVGESPSASAMATWFGVKILAGEKMPDFAILRDGKREVKNLLIYNHYQGTQHGFILLQSI